MGGSWDLVSLMDIEICWHGRGGQGVVTANEILAESAIYSGKYVKAFPEFGPERMGAPIRAFARIQDTPIRVHTQVYEPDIVIVIDPTLIGKVDVAKVQPISFDPFNNKYVVLGETVGNAFKDGLQLNL